MLPKKLFLASTVLIVLVSLPLCSVGSSLETWSQTYGGAGSETAYALVETADGGYALAGEIFVHGRFYTGLIKADEHGVMVWNQTYEGIARGLIETSDGGYALAGGAGLIKIDAYGNMEWNQNYKGGAIRALVETSDGGYALAGWTSSSFASSGESDFWLIKTDGSGDVEWNQTYGRGRSDRAYALVETADGGYALAGETISIGYEDMPHWDFWLVKTDESGVMEWNQTYEQISGSTINEVARALVETSDGGYALTGFISTFNPLTGIDYDCWLVKTDSYGVMEWNRTYGKGSALSLVETSDGGYALAGGAGLIKIDAYGNMEWKQTTGGIAYVLIETSDGGYALAGSKNDDFWLAKTDEQGFIQEFHPPHIRVDSPQNVTYTTDSVSLNFTVNEETSWMGYSIDGQDNVTITETTINLTELADGSHNITVYATDTDGNTAASETIYFTIDTSSTAWVTPVIVIMAVAGAVFLVYFLKTKKTNKPT
ncbi:MAG TPA: hypothetical protein ENN36_05470 [Candidatus Bathyarchaeota archaeon]|nr:hypothetical protein [Candidatus Bathyarchaeota archaeon]